MSDDPLPFTESLLPTAGMIADLIERASLARGAVLSGQEPGEWDYEHDKACPFVQLAATVMDTLGIIGDISMHLAAQQLVEPEIITAFQAASLLGVSYKTVHRLVDTGELPMAFIRTAKGGHRRFRRSEVLALRAKRAAS